MISIQEIKNAKILIVDDNEMNVLVLTKILKQEGYLNIDSTTNPEKVKKLYSENNYDLVLLDLNMPIMDGFSIMKEFKSNYSEKSIPIIVVTAQTDQAVKIRALSLGAKDFISKPIDRLETVNRIKNALETQLMHKELLTKNYDLEEKVTERTLTLQESYNGLINCLSIAAQYKDNETGDHIIRMSNFSRILATSYGFNESHLEDLQHASAMHDIGKIGTPDIILNKPGKLTVDEFEIMKQHTVIGYDILKKANSKSIMIKLGSEIALSHHEKWDGSGYPYGLKGEEIPLSARIVALADVFDALTSERPYKKAWTNFDAVKYINDNSEKHFDPKVVQVFNAVLPEFIKLQEKYKN